MNSNLKAWLIRIAVVAFVLVYDVSIVDLMTGMQIDDVLVTIGGLCYELHSFRQLR